ncbi:MAG: NADPH-dependent glutamate synthase [Coriobacteriales bacterium]|nr:NADPH-dependent glutamate synthase [Coriobacteriales bacterium]
MPNMSPTKVAMPEQDPKARAKNFDEVACGYTAEMAQEEAARCLNCKKPVCIEGCPVLVHIPDFIQKVVEGEFEQAYEIIASTNSLPAVCGRVCPQETQCESKCIRGLRSEPVAIGRLERFVADWHIEHSEKRSIEIVPNGHKVAIVGSGPAGLTCAGDLAMAGCDVTVFEAFHECGGVLVYGIPEFRLPKAIVKREVEGLEDLGVKFRKDVVIGRTMTIDELFEDGYETIFVGSGAGLPMFMGIEGETLLGVFSANEYLTRINLMKAFREDYDTPAPRSRCVAVIGGGNVAMDAARSALRMGAEKVMIVYRRSMEELPARAEEVQHAIEEGVEFNLLRNPVKILSDENGYVCGMECIKMELGEPDASGRRRPVPIEGSEFTMECDAVIMALGTRANPIIGQTTEGLDLNKWNCIVADEESAATTREGVYAGGDAVTGAATVILAMGAGKQAAKSMLEFMGVE